MNVEFFRNTEAKLNLVFKFSEIKKSTHFGFNGPSINGLTKLFVCGITTGINLSILINLKSLCIRDAHFYKYEATLAKKLVKTNKRIDDILPFNRNLNTTVVFHLNRKFKNTLEIEELNREQSHCATQRKNYHLMLKKTYI